MLEAFPPEPVSTQAAIPLSGYPPFDSVELSAQFYREMLEQIPGMVCQYQIISPDALQFSYVSSGCHALLHCAPEALLADASQWLRRIHPSDRPEWLQHLTQAQQALVPWHWEGRLLPANLDSAAVAPSDGQWVRAICQPIRHADGTVYWHALLTDITRDRHTTQHIQQQHQVLTQQFAAQSVALSDAIAALEQRNYAFDISQDLLCVVGFDGYFKRLNPRWTEVLGYSEAELLAKPFIEFVHPGDRHTTLTAHHHTDQNIAITAFENRYICKDGSVRWLLWQSVPAVDQQIVYSSARDITDRKLAEAELQQTKTFLESVLNALPVGVAAKDATDLRFVLWNPMLATLLGVTPENALGKTDHDFFPPEQAELFTRKDREVLDSGQILDIPEEKVSTQSGETRILHTKKTAVLDENNHPLYLLAITEDITDRKRAETQLAEQQRTLKAILNTAPIWIWMTDTKGKIKFVNRTFCENVGVPEEHFLAADHYKEVLGEEASVNCIASDVACLASEAIHHSEEQIPFVDGNIHQVEILKAKIRNDQGQVIGLIGLGMDATERKQAEASLRSYADRQTLLNHLTNQIRHSLNQDTIIDTALSAVRQQLTLDVCGLIWFAPDQEPPTWTVSKEVKSSEIIGSAIGSYPVSFIGPIEAHFLTEGILKIDCVSDYSEPIHRTFLQNIGVQSVVEVPIFLQNCQLGALLASRYEVQAWQEFEVELLQAVAGQLAIALNQANLYTESQNRAQELADTLDQLQRTQMQMIQGEKMSSLGQLVAGVAHEINNPVNFIYGNLSHANDYIKDLLGLVDLYQTHYPNPVREIEEEAEAIDLDFLKGDLLKLLNSMRVGAERIQSIVASLRTFSRMDEAEKKRVNIHEGIDSTLMILQNRIKAKHDRPEVKIVKEYGQLPPVECYAGQLNQVFMNILVNALDALDEHMEEERSRNPDTTFAPMITIQTQCVGADHVQIAIADNGTGIPEAVKARIFDPFYTTKPVGKGTGMGMSISYQIVTERHNGQLTCTSTAGAGTQFTIQVPISQRTPTPVKAES